MKKILIIGSIVFVISAMAVSYLVKQAGKDELSKLNKYFNGHLHGEYFEISDFNVNQAVEIKNATKLEIKNINGNFQIEKSADNQFHIILKSKINKNYFPMDISKFISIKDDVVFLNFAENLNQSKNWFKLNSNEFVFSDSLEVKLSLPNSINKIHIDSVSADYKLSNLNIDEAKLNSISGDFNFIDILIKNMNLNQVSGDTQLQNVNFEDIKIDTISGDINFEYSNPPDFNLALESVSGDLTGDEFFEKYISDKTLKIGQSDRKISITSVSGDVHFEKK